MKYVQISCDPVDFSGSDQRRHLCILIWHYCACVSAKHDPRPSIPKPGVYSAMSTRSPPPTQCAASSVDGVFRVYAGMFNQLRHGETKASRDHWWPSNCSALTSCRMNVHAQKRGISARSFFNLRWQTWSSMLKLGLLHVPK